MRSNENVKLDILGIQEIYYVSDSCDYAIKELDLFLRQYYSRLLIGPPAEMPIAGTKQFVESRY